jgi:hypothetical protein
MTQVYENKRETDSATLKKDALRLHYKRPRHYAADWIRTKDKKALAGCPVEWQDLVRQHIRNFRTPQ